MADLVIEIKIITLTIGLQGQIWVCTSWCEFLIDHVPYAIYIAHKEINWGMRVKNENSMS